MGFSDVKTIEKVASLQDFVPKNIKIAIVFWCGLE